MNGRKGNRLTGACPLCYLSFVFCFLSYLFLFFLISHFLSTLFFLSCSSLVFLPLFWAQWRPFYSACRDRILLFCPLTTFVWSGCTCQPPLVRLYATPHRQKKKNYFVYLLAVAPFLIMVWVPSLSLSLMAYT